MVGDSQIGKTSLMSVFTPLFLSHFVRSSGLTKLVECTGSNMSKVAMTRTTFRLWVCVPCSVSVLYSSKSKPFFSCRLTQSFVHLRPKGVNFMEKTVRDSA